MSNDRYDPSEAEPRLQAAWSAAGIYQFDPADPRPIYAVDTPPPTISGEIHIGHVYSYVQAEALIRYKRMQGYSVYYPFGFDDNGLPTERYVERSRGISAAQVGRADFIKACLETSAAIETRFEEFWQRLGISADWRQRYSSIDPQARTIAQWGFIDLHRKGRIYRAQAPNPWCITCGTAVAQAEMDDAERETTFYTLAFGLAPADEDRPSPRDDASGAGGGTHPTGTQHAASLQAAGLHLPIATTRPELLPACVAVFVHPDDPRYQQLIGRTATLPLLGRSVPILGDGAVDPQKGSGAVMCCTFGDATDVQWWREHRLPLIALLTRQGRLGAPGGAYAGLTLAEARTALLSDLRAAGLLLGERRASQSVRIHDRCDTPLELLETAQWFIRLLDAKDALLEAGRQIAWHPAHMHTRYEHWVQNLSWDWCISRQRIYGVPFPAWHCTACGATTLADAEQLPLDPLTAMPPRPCPCGAGELRPDEDVMDTWATSSLSPQIAGQMVTNPELYGRLFPMQLRPQAHDIIRTWAFYTIARSLFHFGQLPWQTVMISGHALDPAGRKFSKSKGNAPVTPLALIERHSADAVRYWACSAGLGADQPLSEERMKQGRRLITKLWSAGRLYEAQMQHAEYSTEQTPPPNRSIPTDRWLLVTLQSAVAQASARWEAYDYAGALEVAERFFWGTFCDQYLELVKGRLYNGSDAERTAALRTLEHAFAVMLKLFAPMMPHICDELYGRLFPGRGSVHSAAWPTPDATLADPAAERLGSALTAIAGAVRRHKTAQGRSLGAPLAGLEVASADADLLADLRACARDIATVSRAATLAWAADPAPGAEAVAPGLWLVITDL